MNRFRHACARARQAAAVVLIAFTPLLGASSVDGGAQPAAAVKAAFLFRFAGFVDWPGNPGTREAFEFAIVGNESVAAELRTRLPGRTINGRMPAIREHAHVRDAASADIVYLGPGHAAALRSVEPRLGSALVVSDEAGGLARGAMINFVTDSDRVRFEVSLRAAERAGLRLHAGLLSVAVRVEDPPERPGT